MADIDPKVIERFWSKVDPSGECWLWTGGKNSDGYGSFWVGDHNARAHRLAYELTTGSIPPGLDLDHLCRVRGCVRPEHLEPVTRRENTLRGEAGLHMRELTHCKRGHEFTPENTYTAPSGYRRCRTCRDAARDERTATKATCAQCGLGLHPTSLARHLRRAHA